MTPPDNTVRVLQEENRKQDRPPELGRKEKDGFFYRLFHRKKEHRFVVVLPHETRTEQLLEAIWLARRFHTTHEEGKVIAIASSLLHSFLLGTGLFSRCVVLPEDGEGFPRKLIRKEKPHAIFFPYRGVPEDISARRCRVRIRLGSGRSAWFARLVGFQSLERPFSRKAESWFPGLASFDPISFDLAENTNGFSDERVWIDLRGVDGLLWPVGHIARLVRLLQGIGIGSVISLCEEAGLSEEDRIYFKRNLSDTLLLESRSPGELAFLMKSSRIVIGPHGPGVWLAGLLGKQVIALHTRSSRSMSRALTLVKEGNGAGMRPSSQVVREKRPSFPAYRRGKSVVRHLIPEGMGECPAVCEGCSDSDCIHRISPERVFEEVRKILGR